METEGNANVVASVWGANFVTFFPALAVLSQSIWKEKVEIILFFQIDRGKTASVAIFFLQILPPKQTRRPLPCLLFPSFFYARGVTVNHLIIHLMNKKEE